MYGCITVTTPESTQLNSTLSSSSSSSSSPVLQEAISTRDPELVRLVLCYRDYQRTAKRLAGIPLLLERLRQVVSPLMKYESDCTVLNEQVVLYL